MKENNNLIDKVIRARKMQATQNNVNGKLILIARTYGSPIIGHYYNSPLTNEDWENFNDPDKDWSQIDEAEDGNLPRLGYVYDSLRMGVNLEVVVIAKEIKSAITGKNELEKPTEVRCNYRGYRVYHEEEGILKCYAPFPEWEKVIDKVYNQATGTDKKRQVKEKEEEQKHRKNATKKALQTLRMLWGI
jgi:hypothetical protein